MVEIARECTVLFNGIDVGDYFDIAVQSLGLALNIPVSVAGTFQSMITVDYFKGEGGPCWGCMGGLSNTEVIERLLPSKILDLTDISFVPSTLLRGACNIRSTSASFRSTSGTSTPIRPVQAGCRYSKEH